MTKITYKGKLQLKSKVRAPTLDKYYIVFILNFFLIQHRHLDFNHHQDSFCSVSLQTLFCKIDFFKELVPGTSLNIRYINTYVWCDISCKCHMKCAEINNLYNKCTTIKVVWNISNLYILHSIYRGKVALGVF